MLPNGAYHCVHITRLWVWKGGKECFYLSITISVPKYVLNCLTFRQRICSPEESMHVAPPAVAMSESTKRTRGGACSAAPKTPALGQDSGSSTLTQFLSRNSGASADSAERIFE